eukprot:TRINITY_DN11247_c0_g1_i4.p1 TRINITY_DN11247_c0_g1~~TRINITY_DN11247_c0_g1_i4.p1  ORF type:complete len:182 (+),score=35.34 TRINITY_DN11247_c0_g1_i4:91-636(+)
MVRGRLMPLLLSTMLLDCSMQALGVDRPFVHSALAQGGTEEAKADALLPSNLAAGHLEESLAVGVTPPAFLQAATGFRGYAEDAADEMPISSQNIVMVVACGAVGLVLILGASLAEMRAAQSGPQQATDKGPLRPGLVPPRRSSQTPLDPRQAASLRGQMSAPQAASARGQTAQPKPFGCC